ncbi:MAG: hypothetical protein LQ349_006722 [Xanthoria aureola]|nr:MAG: hypothetical protein LQ349_006722 [Xanthoria aureola]
MELLTCLLERRDSVAPKLKGLFMYHVENMAETEELGALYGVAERVPVRFAALYRKNGDPTSGRGIPIIMISAWELLFVLVDDFACRLRFDIEERNDSMKEPTGSHARGAAAEQIPENKLFDADFRSSS